MTSTILIVDDDPVQRRLALAALEKGGMAATSCDSGDAAIDLVTNGSDEAYSAMVLDLVMPGTDGLAVLQTLRERGSQIPVIVQTARGGMDVAIAAMRAGAFDFLVKPVAPGKLTRSVQDALKVAGSASATLARRPAARPGRHDVRLVGDSDEMARVKRLIAKAATSDIPVLIQGESGTGKELVARAIASRGARAGKPLVIVNCGAIPDNLVESILFGHEKGAFTGATERHVGKFSEADGGTLFLDEIGELPQAAQVKLLRAIQDGQIEPVGGRTPQQVDVRLVSATNRDLIAAVRDGSFREDLFYRLNVFPILTPSLRSRPGDIPALINRFIDDRRDGKAAKAPPTIEPAAIALLQAYDWPGNIRQLENEIFRALVLNETGVLTVDDFDHIAAQLAGQRPQLRAVPASPPPVPVAGTPSPAPGPAASALRPATADRTPRHIVSLLDATGHVRALTEIEAEAIGHAMVHYGGQMSEIARRLGIGRSTLYRKLREHDIADPRKGE
ncbi:MULTISPECIES: sigma-54 dependent transcriptional regulator [unclassified Roseitalea]|uniref:sigma-54-dependent transcriptional regulator n=1 Tax=unclassified Roseitalea TaxID=2639107 RepID=UPI00273D4F80|nr:MULTISPECIES: sigma-54 dependent transcriptional regulator [unclassified Roseitalea]